MPGPMYKLKTKPEDFIVEEIPLHKFRKRGKYSYYLLEKKDYTTEQAVQTVCRYTRTQRKFISYAGNKDKKAITKQYVSSKVPIRDISINNIKLTKVGRGDEPISTGDLIGNKFIITIRNIEKKPSAISKVINYFGEQRFGRNNLDVGLEILKKNFEQAAHMIKHNSVQHHLKKYPNDHIGAIRTVPFKTLRLYVHSVQSYFFNELAAKIVREYTDNINAVDYKHGEYLFTFDNIRNRTLPLISFDTETDIYDTLLRKFTLQKRDFVIRQIPQVTPRGGERDLVVRIKNLRISGFKEDELNTNKKVVVAFTLSKGSYATIAVKKMLSK
jgi:tRNA pseudouridine13 synthase